MNRYALIGVGGTGSILLPQLHRFLTHWHRNQGEDTPWALALIDGDTVDEGNLTRQSFDDFDIGTLKIDAAANQIDDNAHVLRFGEYLTDANIKTYIPDGTTVLIAVDNFPVRARIETHVATLQNGTVINGGNEVDSGSCQIWIRRDGRNITPPVSFLHPEILGGGLDRAGMDCVTAAALPGGEQLLIANMASATWMLTALYKSLTSDLRWNDLNFDLMAGRVEAADTSPRRGWAA